MIDADTGYREHLAKVAQPIAEKVHALIGEEFLRLMTEGDDAGDANVVTDAVLVAVASVLGATAHAARQSLEAIFAQVRQGFEDQAKRAPYAETEETNAEG
jgi:hypothetical protein